MRPSEGLLGRSLPSELISQHYEIRGLSLNWFKSYLSNRKQFVEYNKIKSDIKAINCGAPQGSVLGHLLFLIYINGSPNTLNILKSVLFLQMTRQFMHQLLHWGI